MQKICACLILLVFSGCATTESEIDTQKAFDAHQKIGMGFLIAQNYPASLKEFLLAKAILPNNPVVHNNLALVYFFRDHYADSEKELKHALELNPRYSDARNNLGRLYIELAQYQDAIRELSICEQDLTYNSPEKVQYNLGLAYYRLGSYNEARGHVQRALAKVPKMCESNVLIGETYFQTGDYRNAETELAKAQANCDDSIKEEINYYTALSYFHIGEISRSKGILEELLSAHPTGSFARRAQSALRIMR